MGHTLGIYGLMREWVGSLWELCLEQQSSLLATGPKPQEKFDQVFQRGEAEYMHTNFKNQIANLC